MKILMINSVCGIRSTGSICTDLAKELEKRGHIVRIAYGRGNVPEEYKEYAYRIGNNIDVAIHGVAARIKDNSGFESRLVTKRFIKWIEQFDPDLIHLHNLHGYYLNIPLLVEYLTRSNKRVIWTLHDCWPFTGHCCYFDYEGCDRWITGCRSCPQRKMYPASFIDKSSENFELKRTLFSKFPDMTLVTPSLWLGNLVRQSFMGKYPVKIIPNWVDLEKFKRIGTEAKNRYGTEGRTVVLGVSSGWEKRKGLDDFFLLRDRLDENYQIMLLGLNNKQLKELPEGIIGISQTDSIDELAKIYSAADVYVNPTYEDNYPTTNLEAIACGTPVVTYDTGGSRESAEMYGMSVEKGNINKLTDAVIKTSQEVDMVFPDLQKDNEKSLSAYISLVEGKES